MHRLPRLIALLVSASLLLFVHADVYGHAGLATDTLFSFEGVEFSGGADTPEYMEVPDDVVFTDGEPILDETGTGGEVVTIGHEQEEQTLWAIFIAGLI